MKLKNLWIRIGLAAGLFATTQKPIANIALKTAAESAVDPILEIMVQDHVVMPIAVKDLPEEWQQECKSLARRNNLRSPKIAYKLPHHDGEHPRLFTTDLVHNYISVNGTLLESPKQVRDSLPSNNNIAEALRKGRIIKAEDVFSRDPKKEGFMDKYYAIAKNLGLSPSPQLYIRQPNEYSAYEGPGAQSGITKEGAKYVIVYSETMRFENCNAQLAIISHELVHDKYDITPDRMALEINDSCYSRYVEARADRIGTGPLGVDNPFSMIQALLSAESLYKAHLSKEDFAEFERDKTHPSIAERVQALRQEAKDMGIKR